MMMMMMAMIAIVTAAAIAAAIAIAIVMMKMITTTTSQHAFPRSRKLNHLTSPSLPKRPRSRNRKNQVTRQQLTMTVIMTGVGQLVTALYYSAVQCIAS